MAGRSGNRNRIPAMLGKLPGTHDTYQRGAKGWRMTEWMPWVATGVMTAVIGAIGWLLRTVANLPADYVPRDQVNSRFDAIKAEIHGDMKAQEDRTEKRFDQMLQYLIRIEGKIDNKADK